MGSSREEEAIVGLIANSRRSFRDWRARRRERRRAKGIRSAEKEAARHAALRGRDQHTGGYGDQHHRDRYY